VNAKSISVIRYRGQLRVGFVGDQPSPTQTTTLATVGLGSGENASTLASSRVVGWLDAFCCQTNQLTNPGVTADKPNEERAGGLVARWLAIGWQSKRRGFPRSTRSA
jgi:hypothetical protein